MSQGAPPSRWGQPSGQGDAPPWQPSNQASPQQAQPYQGPPYRPYQPSKTNALAVASLVCGILWGFGLLALAAIILGAVARRQIAERGESGSGLATAGLVLGTLGVLGTILLSIVAASVTESVNNSLDQVLSSTTVPEAETPTTAASGPATSFKGEGVYRVGVDIAPGTYRTPGPAAGEPLCYWERQSGFGGGFDAIIANENLQGPGVVTIAPTDKGFKTSGCQRWEMV